jgi:hypothetical protein
VTLIEEKGVVQWPGKVPPGRSNLRIRLEGVIAIFRAIEAGEFLSAIPECEVARAQHSTALHLIAIAEREIVALFEEVSGAA